MDLALALEEVIVILVAIELVELAYHIYRMRIHEKKVDQHLAKMNLYVQKIDQHMQDLEKRTTK